MGTTIREQTLVNFQKDSVSRRDAIRAGAAGVAAAAINVGSASVAAEPGKASEAGAGPAGLIDAHAHIWTPDTTKYPLAGGYRREEMRPASFTPGELLELARPCGVARVVLVQMSFYGFDNAYMLDTIRAYPGVFSGIAVIDDSAGSPREEMRRLKPLGVRGFRIYPRNLPVDRWLDGAGMQAMWKCAASDGMAMCCLVNIR